MGTNSKIHWLEKGGATWNPTYGCCGCELNDGHCFAARMSARFTDRYSVISGEDADACEAGRGCYNEVEGGPITTDGRFNGKIAHAYNRLNLPLHWKKPRRIFVNSMGDLFAPGVSCEYWRSIVGVMTDCPQHTFMILTKQPARMKEFVTGCPPTPNVWLGVSVTDQKTADQRTEILRKIPAAVRWISAEPLLAPIKVNLEGIGWLVSGGESGPGARLMRPEWVRSLRDQCQEAKVSFFFKSYGKALEKIPEKLYRLKGEEVFKCQWHDGLPVLDGRVWKEFPASNQA